MTVICEPDQLAAAALAALVGGRPRLVTSLPDAARVLAIDPEETVVVVGTGIDPEQALPFATLLRREDPTVAVILVREWLDFRLLARAAGAGVREVYALSDGAVIGEACRRWEHRPPAVPARRPGSSGRVVTVLAAKGGCGKTTLATNLAVVLAAGGTRRVCLLDLDLGFGDVAGVLRLDPRRSLIDAVDRERRLDGAAVADLVTPYRQGLDCILAPVGPGEPEKVPPALVADLLALLPSMYDHVVVDTPAQLSAHVLAALDASDHHLLVTTPEVPALRSLRRTLDVLDLLAYGGSSTRSVVFNRSGTRSGLAVSEIEATVRGPVAAHIPASADVPVSVNRGVPLAVALPDHPVSRAVRRLAESRLVGTG